VNRDKNGNNGILSQKQAKENARGCSRMADVCDVRTVILKCNGPTMFSSQELMRCHKQALTVDAYVQAIWDRRNAPGQAVPYAVAGQDIDKWLQEIYDHARIKIAI